MIFTCPICGLGYRLEDKNITEKESLAQVIQISYNCGAVLHLIKQGIYWTKTIEKTCKKNWRADDE